MSLSGEAQVSYRVAEVRIDAELSEHQVRFERTKQRWNNRVERLQPHFVAGIRSERHVNRITRTVSPTRLIRVSGPGEQELPAFVNRNRQDPVRFVKTKLNPIAMMTIDVHVSNAQAVVNQALDGDYRVVENAEPGSAGGHGMMVNPAGNRKCDWRGAGHDQLRRHNGTAR